MLSPLDGGDVFFTFRGGNVPAEMIAFYMRALVFVGAKLLVAGEIHVYVDVIIAVFIEYDGGTHPVGKFDESQKRFVQFMIILMLQCRLKNAAVYNMQNIAIDTDLNIAAGSDIGIVMLLALQFPEGFFASASIMATARSTSSLVAFFASEKSIRISGRDFSSSRYTSSSSSPPSHSMR